MAGGGQVGGQGSIFKRGIWLFIAACIAVAVLGDAPNHPDGIYGWAKEKSGLVEGVATDTHKLLQDGLKDAENGGGIKFGDGSTGGFNFGGGSKSGSGSDSNSGGNVIEPATSTETKNALNNLNTATETNVSYDRNEWPTWDNVRTCWTVREEVLYRDAKSGTATLKNRNGAFTKNADEACEITGGVWIDPYTGQKFTNPSDLDIDHMVPLGNAARSGGQSWSLDKKRDFANSLSYSGHLLAVSASANRSKSDRSPAEWQPINRSFHCQYATAWTTVKTKWGLTATTAEKAALKEMFSTC